MKLRSLIALSLYVSPIAAFGWPHLPHCEISATPTRVSVGEKFVLSWDQNLGGGLSGEGIIDKRLLNSDFNLKAALPKGQRELILKKEGSYKFSILGLEVENDLCTVTVRVGPVPKNKGGEISALFVSPKKVVLLIKVKSAICGTNSYWIYEDQMGKSTGSGNLKNGVCEYKVEMNRGAGGGSVTYALFPKAMKINEINREMMDEKASLHALAFAVIDVPGQRN